MKTLVLIVGLICVLLGGLWSLQGLGLVHVRPLLCVADCAAIQGASPTWAGIGLAMVAAGLLGVAYALRRR